MGHGWTEIAKGQDVTFDGEAQVLAEFLDSPGIDKADIPPTTAARRPGLR